MDTIIGRFPHAAQLLEDDRSVRARHDDNSRGRVQNVRGDSSDVCDAALTLELRTGLLRHCEGGRDSDQHDAENAGKATVRGLH
jgi:hypothetical protein